MKKDMRALLTRRLLQEGLLRLLQRKSLEKITIQELCAESGINRTTFYKRYQAPIQVLQDLAWDYAEHLQAVFSECMRKPQTNETDAVEACCEYLFEKRDELRILFSENAGRHLEEAAMEIMSEMIRMGKAIFPQKEFDQETKRLYVSASGMAAYGLIRCWLVEDIHKKPEEIVAILGDIFREDRIAPLLLSNSRKDAGHRE